MTPRYYKTFVQAHDAARKATEKDGLPRSVRWLNAFPPNRFFIYVHQGSGGYGVYEDATYGEVAPDAT